MAVVVKKTTVNFYKVHRILTADGTNLRLFEQTNEAESTPGGGVTENGSLATPIDSASEFSMIPVQMEIKELTDTGNKLYLTVSMTKIEAGVKGSTPSVSQAHSLLPASKYRIADIFSGINPKDAHFLKYVPDGFLSQEQIEAKRGALAEDERRIGTYEKKQYSISEETSTTEQDDPVAALPWKAQQDLKTIERKLVKLCVEEMYNPSADADKTRKRAYQL